MCVGLIEMESLLAPWPAGPSFVSPVDYDPARRARFNSQRLKVVLLHVRHMQISPKAMIW